MFSHKVRLFGLVIVVILLSAWGIASAERPAPLLSPAPQDVIRQGTPGPVILPSATRTPEPPAPTATRTPTPQGLALVEAKNPDANVRAAPDLSADRVGRIQPGERYVVLAKRFEWYQIEYPNTPTRIAWVHRSVVDLIGDESLIPEISQDRLPTVDATLAAQRETELAVTQTPGGIITLTAQAFITPQGLFTTAPDFLPTNTLAPGERLPTFTYPPFTNTPLPIQELQARRTVSQDGQSQFPPAIPILGLAALGLFGIFVGIFRRL